MSLSSVPPAARTVSVLALALVALVAPLALLPQSSALADHPGIENQLPITQSARTTPLPITFANPLVPQGPRWESPPARSALPSYLDFSATSVPAELNPDPVSTQPVESFDVLRVVLNTLEVSGTTTDAHTLAGTFGLFEGSAPPAAGAAPVCSRSWSGSIDAGTNQATTFVPLNLDAPCLHLAPSASGYRAVITLDAVDGIPADPTAPHRVGVFGLCFAPESGAVPMVSLAGEPLRVYEDSTTPGSTCAPEVQFEGTVRFAAATVEPEPTAEPAPIRTMPAPLNPEPVATTSPTPDASFPGGEPSPSPVAPSDPAPAPTTEPTPAPAPAPVESPSPEPVPDGTPVAPEPETIPVQPDPVVIADPAPVPAPVEPEPTAEPVPVVELVCPPYCRLGGPTPAPTVLPGVPEPAPEAEPTAEPCPPDFNEPVPVPAQVAALGGGIPAHCLTPIAAPVPAPVEPVVESPLPAPVPVLAVPAVVPVPAAELPLTGSSWTFLAFWGVWLLLGGTATLLLTRRSS